MPHGKLFFKTASTNGWVDAYDTYGMSLEDGALSKIITPAPHKAPVTSSGVTSHGRAMLGSSIGKKDGRTMSFDVHFTGATEAQFLTRYYAFCQQVLDAGYVKMYVVLPGGDPFPKFNNAKTRRRQTREKRHSSPTLTTERRIYLPQLGQTVCG